MPHKGGHLSLTTHSSLTTVNMRGLLVIVLVASIFSATSAIPTWGDIAKAWEDAKDTIQAGYDEHVDPLVDKAKEAWDEHVDPILEALKEKARNFVRERKDDFSDFSDKLKAQSDQMVSFGVLVLISIS